VPRPVENVRDKEGCNCRREQPESRRAPAAPERPAHGEIERDPQRQAGEAELDTKLERKVVSEPRQALPVRLPSDGRLQKGSGAETLRRTVEERVVGDPEQLQAAVGRE